MPYAYFFLTVICLVWPRVDSLDFNNADYTTPHKYIYWLVSSYMSFSLAHSYYQIFVLYVPLKITIFITQIYFTHSLLPVKHTLTC